MKEVIVQTPADLNKINSYTSVMEFDSASWILTIFQECQPKLIQSKKKKKKHMPSPFGDIKTKIIAWVTALSTHKDVLQNYSRSTPASTERD